MNPISFNTAGVSPLYGQMRPELPLRRGAGGQDANDLGSIPSSPAGPNQAPGFDNVLGHFVKEVNAKHMAAGDAVTGLLSGQGVPLHQAMVAMEEASVSFQLMVEVRNKLLEGYQELMRMQV